jgi:hypothetical protein
MVSQQHQAPAKNALFAITERAQGFAYRSVRTWLLARFGPSLGEVSLGLAETGDGYLPASGVAVQH